MRRNLPALLFALCAPALHGVAAAATPEFQITPRVGLGSLKVDEFEGVNKQRVQRDSYGIGVGLGYLTPIGVVVEVGADSFRNFNLWQSFDSFRLSQEFASIGYQFDLGHRWRLVPRVGHAWWELHSEEGRIFHPGPEAVRNVRGESFFWEIGFAHQVSDVVTLGATFRQGQYDFGRTQSGAFTVTLGF